MSDKGEKMCPLCTEEMDLTDQQLKPCKCGYEICVWCWHHVMEMAEKDNTEGRCPACRTPYNKEKIVGTTAKCERLVAQVNSERKQKLQKAKPKGSEARKHLTDVRVIQRNLVYIIGLPLNLADEDLLQRREYFGQYGKVSKVSISRTATGVIQHSSNNSCCVYITYSKEEEAVRCIQSVHQFVLEGRALRACFGTTKYCHSWLRNLSCINPDCLYLHDFGSQEDSFTKDEIVYAFTRSRVQQIVGATNNLQRRSGDVLPPPGDDYGNIDSPLTAKPTARSPSNDVRSQVGEPCADSCVQLSSALPAAASWVTRLAASPSPATSLSSSGAHPKKKSETCSSSQLRASEAASTKTSTHDVRRPMAVENCEVPNGELGSLGIAKQYSNRDCKTAVVSTDAEAILAAEAAAYKPAPPLCTSPLESGKPSCSHSLDKEVYTPVDKDVQSLCSGLLSVSIHSHLEDKCSSPVPNSSVSNLYSDNLPGNIGSLENINEQSLVCSTSLALREDEKDFIGFDNSLLKSSERICDLPSMPTPSLLQNQSSCHSRQLSGVSNKNNPYLESEVPMRLNEDKADKFAKMDNTYEYSHMMSDTGKKECIGNWSNNVPSINRNVSSGMGESSIIADILSMDFDPWDDSLTSPHSLVKFLYSENDREHGSPEVPSSCKVQNSKQSRFSFARQDDLQDPASLEHSIGYTGYAPDIFSSSNFTENKDPWADRVQQIFRPSSIEDSVNIPSSYSLMSSTFSVPKAPLSTPPGFSAPSRPPPPPGFSSHGRVEHAFSSSANHLFPTSTPPSLGNHLFQTSAPLSPVNHLFQMPAQPTRNARSTSNIEYIDPAILEVREGMSAGLSNSGFDVGSALFSQLNRFENETRLNPQMPQSISTHQSFRSSDHLGNRYSSHNDAYSTSPMLPNHSQVNNPSAFSQLTDQQLRTARMSNGHWGSCNQVSNVGDQGMSEVLRNERLGYNRLIPNYEDLKFRLYGSGSLYDQGFGM